MDLKAASPTGVYGAVTQTSVTAIPPLMFLLWVLLLIVVEHSDCEPKVPTSIS
jgi:hypothetical protein